MGILDKFLGKNTHKGPELKTLKESDIKYTSPSFKDGKTKALVRYDSANVYRVSIIDDENHLHETTKYQFYNSQDYGWYYGFIIVKDTKDVNARKYLFDKNLEMLELPYGDYSFSRINDGYIWTFAEGAGYTRRGVINKNLKELIPPVYKEGVYLGKNQFEMKTPENEIVSFVIEGDVAKII